MTREPEANEQQLPGGAYRSSSIEVPRPPRRTKLAVAAVVFVGLAAASSLSGGLSCAAVSLADSSNERLFEAALFGPVIAIVLMVVVSALNSAARRAVKRDPTLHADGLTDWFRHLAILFGVGLAIWALTFVVGIFTIDLTQGRPFRRRGRTRFGRIRLGRRSHARPRSAVGAALWAKFALEEAASVPAFERLAAHLEQLGAPATLVARVHRARADEARHTRLCERTASYFGGVWVRASKPSPDTSVAAPQLRALAAEQLLDGCVGEGYAARYATRAAESVSEPELRRTLRTIAADERRHADDAWAIVQWAVSREPALWMHLERALEQGPDRPQRPLPRWIAPRAAPHVGLLERSEQHRLFEETRASLRRRLRASRPASAAGAKSRER
ncbi:MAG: ferritin-like domain-containing protein [Myxococcota bacterium]